MTIATDLPPPVNHVFVDFENVHEIDLTVIGGKSVRFTLLMGMRQTKLDVSLVEKLLRHAASVELVRLGSGGKNALDFTLAYYVGRAVATEPTGYFHIVSKDAGYDPLIQHLRSKHIHAHRHDNFTTLVFCAPAKQAAATPPTAVPKAKSPSKPKAQPAGVDEREIQLLEHLRKNSTTRPRNKKKLVSYLIAHLGHNITGAEALVLIKNLGQAGHLFIDEKDKVNYHLEQA